MLRSDIRFRGGENCVAGVCSPGYGPSAIGLIGQVTLLERKALRADVSGENVQDLLHYKWQCAEDDGYQDTVSERWSILLAGQGPGPAAGDWRQWLGTDWLAIELTCRGAADCRGQGWFPGEVGGFGGLPRSRASRCWRRSSCRSRLAAVILSTKLLIKM